MSIRTSNVVKGRGAGGAKHAGFWSAPLALTPAILRLDKLPPSQRYRLHTTTPVPRTFLKGRVAPAYHVRASHFFKGRGAGRANQAGYVWVNHDNDDDGSARGQHHAQQRYGLTPGTFQRDFYSRRKPGDIPNMSPDHHRTDALDECRA